jgi:Ca2+-binding RTX toxin-like protein
MSTPTTGKNRRAVGLLAALAATLGLFLTIGASSAFGVTCSTDPVTHTTYITMAGGEAVTVSLGAGEVITANTTGCGGNTSNVDLIVVYGTDAFSESLTISEANGRFEPGFTAEGPLPSINEIEWYINLGETFVDGDTLTVSDIQTAGAVRIGEGGAAPIATIFDEAAGVGDPLVSPPAPPATVLAPGRALGDETFGGTFINMNSFPADGDADIQDGGAILAGVSDTGGESIENITILGNGGNDDLSAKGGNGTGVTAGQACLSDGVAPDPNDDSSPFITLDGGSGDDFLQGSECGDRLIGGPGTDQVQGNGPAVAVVTCLENETGAVYTGASSGDFLVLDTGPLTVVFNADGTISVTPTGDFFSGIEGVEATPQNDIVIGNAANNLIAGGGGDDFLAGNGGSDCVLGGSGNDTLSENAVTLSGGAPVQSDPGAAGNGADALDGGPGSDDVVDYSQRSSRTVVNLGLISWFNDGADTNADSVSNECDDVFFTTENAITGSGNHLLSADYLNNQSDNEFTGGNGNDAFEGGAGNDIFHEGTSANGSDAIEGDAGSDTVDYSGRSNPVTVSFDGVSNDGEVGEGDNAGAVVTNFGPAGCTDTVFPIINPDPWINLVGTFEPFAGDEADDADSNALEIENAMGGSGADDLTGNAAANNLTGNAGNDTIFGLGGTDRLSGGDGDDDLSGGDGNDAIDGGAGTNTASWEESTFGVTVQLFSGTARGQGNDTLTAIANVDGSDNDDTIFGDENANILNGHGGDDAVQGRQGDDKVNGGAGDDELNGNGGNDSVHGGRGDDTLRGAVGSDLLKGDPGEDTAYGGRDDDRIHGGAGADFMDGGAGNDICRPNAPGFGNGDQAVNC